MLRAPAFPLRIRQGTFWAKKIIRFLDRNTRGYPLNWFVETVPCVLLPPTLHTDAGVTPANPAETFAKEFIAALEGTSTETGKVSDAGKMGTPGTLTPLSDSRRTPSGPPVTCALDGPSPATEVQVGTLTLSQAPPHNWRYSRPGQTLVPAATLNA